MAVPRTNSRPSFDYHPVTPDRLTDLARFSTEHGKFRYCSCMRWRLKSTEFSRSTKAERIDRLDELVTCGVPVGVLAYVDAEPVGWCSIAPRETYEGLERYRALPRLDDAPVWSVVCFFVDRRWRRHGLTLGLLTASVNYARSKGARIIEGYPVPADARLYTYMGSPSTYRAVGFREVTPAGQARSVLRYVVRE
jgi:GNAT superfamily N-acetyltransferase